MYHCRLRALVDGVDGALVGDGTAHGDDQDHGAWAVVFAHASATEVAAMNTAVQLTAIILCPSSTE